MDYAMKLVPTESSTAKRTRSWDNEMVNNCLLPRGRWLRVSDNWQLTPGNCFSKNASAEHITARASRSNLSLGRVAAAGNKIPLCQLTKVTCLSRSGSPPLRDCAVESGIAPNLWRQ